ncbi:hypothetical protein [Flagellimonas sp.]|uniref:hypothetical protein n=1 Tax=Flagellimonas sp. TaxID=2058762 RepID=UPI003F4A5397
MKKKYTILLILPVLLSAQIICSQEHSFTLNDDQLIWQNVYRQNLKLNDIEKAIRLKGQFEEFAVSDTQIICTLKPFKLDFKSLGKKSMFTSIYIQQMFLTGLLVVDVKEGRHRVTFKNLKMAPKEDTALWSANDIEGIEFYALKKHSPGYRKNFLKNDVEIFEYNLKKLVDFKTNNKDDDW